MRFLMRSGCQGAYRRRGINIFEVSLRTLEEAGLVSKEHRGRLVIYRANMQNFLLREFKILLTLLDSSEFRNLEAKDRPLFERINMGKVIQ